MQSAIALAHAKGGISGDRETSGVSASARLVTAALHASKYDVLIHAS